MTRDLGELLEGVTRDFLQDLNGEIPSADLRGVVSDPPTVFTGVLKTRKSALLGVLKTCLGNTGDLSVSGIFPCSGA